jgi:hypothetical protein
LALVFTRRADVVLGRIAVGAVLTAGLCVAGLYYYAPPEYTRVGYAPSQPVGFSHELHAGRLGMDCRYCHANVEESPHAGVPATQTCMNCHQAIKTTSPALAAVRASWSSGDPIEWNRVHEVPDFVFFNHAVHVRRGVGCASCHGAVNEMPVVRHDQPLSMGWCLSCHRSPEDALRPASEITNMAWHPPVEESRRALARERKDEMLVKAPTHCGGCHR